MVSCDWDTLQEMWNSWDFHTTYLRMNSSKLRVILTIALLSLTCTPIHCPERGNMKELQFLWGTIIWRECPCGTKIGVLHKPTSQVKEVPHWASRLQQCILMGVRGELDKGASLCSGARSLFWGQRGPCFFTLEKEACLQGHIISHLWTEHGENILSNSTNLFSSQKISL